MEDPIENHPLIVCDQRRIENAEGVTVENVDLGDVCIIPGLINAHAHLEFSDVAHPLDSEGGLERWLGRAIEFRSQQLSGDSPTLIERRKNAIQAGLREARENGTSWLLDNVTEPWSHDWGTDDCRMSEFTQHEKAIRGQTTVAPSFELRGLTADRWRKSLQFARSEFDSIRDESQRNASTMGLAPHAPYSTPLEVVREAAQLANMYRTFVTMHVAESKEERQWLENGDGPMRELLSAFVDDVNSIPRHSISEYLVELGKCPRSLVVHGNYLTDVERLWMSTKRKSMAVVYCPRTHSYFCHDEHPWRVLQSLGINVFLGTDSRASNPDLNILEEARFLHETHRDIHPTKLISMITTEPRAFLSLPLFHSGITRERHPILVHDFAAFATEGVAPKELGEYLLSGQARPQLLTDWIAEHQNFQRNSNREP